MLAQFLLVMGFIPLQGMFKGISYTDKFNTINSSFHKGRSVSSTVCNVGQEFSGTKLNSQISLKTVLFC